MDAAAPPLELDAMAVGGAACVVSPKSEDTSIYLPKVYARMCRYLERLLE